MLTHLFFKEKKLFFKEKQVFAELLFLAYGSTLKLPNQIEPRLLDHGRTRIRGVQVRFPIYRARSLNVKIQLACKTVLRYRNLR